jgi:hypothetical protein
MRTLKVSIGLVASVALLVAGLVVTRPQVAQAQGDPHLGTWVLNVAKSKYTPGPPPKEQTSVYSASGQGIKVATKGTDYAANFDGKDYPATGNPDWDAVSIKRVDSHTIEFTRKKAGKTVQTATSVVSKDGKTRTITTNGVNAQGQKISTVGVYEKK